MDGPLGANGRWKWQTIHFDPFGPSTFDRIRMTHLRLKLQFLEFKKAFLKFDTDGNGYITKSELKKAMKELGEKLSKEELADMMNEGNSLTYS